MGDFGGIFLRMIMSMTVVIALMMLAARVANRRRGMTPRGSSQRASIEVMARQGLSKNTSIAVVRIGAKTMVLGITEASVSKVDDFEDEIRGEVDITEGLDELAHDVNDGPEANWTALPGRADEETLAAFSQSRKGMLEQLREMTVRRS